MTNPENSQKWFLQYMRESKKEPPVDRLAWLEEQLADLPKREIELRKQDIEPGMQVKRIPIGKRTLPGYKVDKLGRHVKWQKMTDRRIYWQTYYLKHKQECAERMREYYQQHKAEFDARAKAWRRSEKGKAYVKAYNEHYRQLRKEQNALYRQSLELDQK